ncbi:MAG: hypothetical protein JNM28_04440 [Armatimonadetes bacterium]|nr:hypothetical protein [Armatimonadota bacterium]MBS1710246.1 hypothetical protein [Armatimonadota bacterium]MBX3109117.1 hypothetical protein [Fimbriimonadaceae bacterium]
MRNVWLVGIATIFACSAFLAGCGSSEPAPTEGDAAVTKDMPKGEAPAAAGQRDAAGTKASSEPMTLEPPPSDGK